MKKVITICLLVVVILIGGMTMEAKTTKKAKTKSNSTVIGKFKYYDDTISLLSNGRIKSSSKEIDGFYAKIKGAYKVTLTPTSDYYGHWLYEWLIVGDNIYIIGGGNTNETIHDFTFNPSDNSVTIINTSDMSDREFMKYNSLPSMTVPLSHFEKFGKVTWIKKKP